MTYPVVFIVSTINDMRRLDQGLYHYPKLANAAQIKAAIEPLSNCQSIDCAIDREGDHVAYLLQHDFSAVSVPTLKEQIITLRDKLVTATRAAKAPDQPLDVRVKDVYSMGLRDLGITIPGVQINSCD